jgi:HPt (histidine-containing phosphotransfer) domain-containing protein
LVEVPQKDAVVIAKKPIINPPKTSQVFDPTQRTKLQALRLPKGGNVWNKALDIFCREMPGRLSALDLYVREHRAESLSIAAHTIAGSAANIGAPMLRAAGLSLENAAHNGTWDAIPQLLEALMDAWKQLQPELTKTDKS